MKQFSIFLAKNVFILFACLYIINSNINYSIKIIVTLATACTIVLSFQTYMKESFKYMDVKDYVNEEAISKISDDQFDKLVKEGTLRSNIFETNLDTYQKKIDSVNDIHSEDDIDSEYDSSFKNSQLKDIEVSNFLKNLKNNLNRDIQIAKNLVEYKNTYDKNKYMKHKNRLYASTLYVGHDDKTIDEIADPPTNIQSQPYYHESINDG